MARSASLRLNPSLRGRNLRPRGPGRRDASAAVSVDRLINVPLIFVALLQDQGWPVAAFAHRTRPRTWCVKVTKSAVMTLSETGEMQWQGAASPDLRRLEAVLAQARAVHADAAGVVRR